MRIVPQNININFIGRRKQFLIVSSSLVFLSIIIAIVIGPKLGTDFRGGTMIQVKFGKKVEVGRIRSELEQMNFIAPDVQNFGDEEGFEILVKVSETTLTTGKMADSFKDNLYKTYGNENIERYIFNPNNNFFSIRFKDGMEKIDPTKMDELLTSAGIENSDIKEFGTVAMQEFQIAPMGVASFIEKQLKTLFKDTTISIERVEFVGPKVGAQLRDDGILAILATLFFILLYIAFRFDAFFAPGAVAALVHDVLITVGIFIIIGKEFDLPIIAALLTIVGYSLNDTVVLFDRIRDNTVKYKNDTLEKMVNTSVNQTLSRTLLTSVTTLLVVTALLMFGGSIIHDFSMALLIGVLVGTYSSIFIASPVYIFFRRRFGIAK